MMYIRDYIKSSGVIVPEVLKTNIDVIDVENSSSVDFDIYNAENCALIEKNYSQQELFDFLKNVEDKIVPLMKKTFICKNINFEKFDNIFISNISIYRNVWSIIYSKGFKNQAKKEFELGLWDMFSYSSKPNENFALFIPELKSTYISCELKNNLWSYFAFAHEVGHSYFNFINKKFDLTFKERIDSETMAFSFEVESINLLNNNKIKENFILRFYSKICIYASYLDFMLVYNSGVLSTLDEIVRYFKESFLKYNPSIYSNESIEFFKKIIQSEIEKDHINVESAIYFISRYNTVKNYFLEEF